MGLCSRLQRLAGKAFLLPILATAMLSPVAILAQGGAPAAPPVAPIRPVVDEYFGTKITDPYRYIENLSDPEVDAWFKAQNAFTRAALAKIPGRDVLLGRIRELDRSKPARVTDLNIAPGGRYFYEKTLPEEIVSRLYVRDGLNGTERLLLNPEKYPAPEGSHNTINYYSPSWDGKMVAVGISPGGSENAVVHILEVDTDKELAETIDRVRFGPVSWRTDNRSFFYNRLQKLAPGQPQTDFEQKSVDYLHELGASPETDPAVFGFGLSPLAPVDPIDLPFLGVTANSPWAIAFVAHGVLNEQTLYVAPADSVGKPGTPWKKICDVPDAVTNVTVHGDDLYLLTHKDAPHFKVLRTSLAHPDLAHAETVIPETDHVIKNIAATGDALYIQETDGTISLLKRLDYRGGTPEQVQLPFEGTVSIDVADERFPGALIRALSWARGARIYSFDPKTHTLADTKLQPLGPYDDPQNIVSEEVKVESWDGALVALSIVHRRDLQMDQSNPALLEGYGSYGISIDPFYDPMMLAWLEKGGVYAWAHPRGGGELGEDWHKGGQKLTKPNTWRDFIACADYLIDKRYTSSARIAGEGGSAGGITIGRALTERPELFAAAIDDVGVSNALRGEETPNGPPNIPEFGTVKSQWGFEDLYAMDAYHHVRDGVNYPAVLLTTGWNDPRVASWEPGKMAARLQAATHSGKPVLLRVDYSGGHGIGSTKQQLEDELADRWSFLLWQFGLSGFQPGDPASAQK